MKEIYEDAKSKMEKAVESLRQDLNSLRAGRANPTILDGVKVDYYGTKTPLNQLANISAPEARMILIQPYDKSAIENIEKAILQSDLGLNPNNDGSVVRLTIPELTEERREELVKLVKQKGEESKVAIRNIRRDANDALKSKEKAKELSEDDLKREQDNIQKLTDEKVNEVEEVLKAKNEEITSI